MSAAVAARQWLGRGSLGSLLLPPARLAGFDQIGRGQRGSQAPVTLSAGSLQHGSFRQPDFLPEGSALQSCVSRQRQAEAGPWCGLPRKSHGIAPPSSVGLSHHKLRRRAQRTAAGGGPQAQVPPPPPHWGCCRERPPALWDLSCFSCPVGPGKCGLHHHRVHGGGDNRV